jgi:hypothetical protein
MRCSALALALLAALAAPGAAQDGGKLNWKGKGLDPIRPAFDDAVRDGRPMMILFSVEGSKECVELSAGALSHPDVVDAAAQLTCIFVECGGNKNQGLVKQLGITQFPTILFADSSGTTLGGVPQRDGPGLASAMRDLNSRATQRPRFNQDVDKSLAAARQAGRPLVLYFYDESPACVTVNKSFADPEVRPLGTRFDFSMTLLARGSDLSTRFDVDHAPTILVLNPRLPKPEAKPLARITGSRTPRELRRDLEEVLEAMKTGGLDPAPASSVPVPATKDDKKEQLSDDEIDRKFIQARLAVASDLQKHGMKDKAIAVLEDLLQSYPKHVLTKNVRDLLEQLKK